MIKAGFVCAKSGYGPGSNYMMMSAKVNCGYSGHNHMDMLSLFLTMRGKDIIGEPYTGHLYHNIRMNSELRGYMYNMPSHNTVLAYGNPIAPNEVYANKWGVYRPTLPITRCNSEKEGFYVSAYHDGYTFCRHTREVLFHREQGLIVSNHIMRGNRMDTPHIQRFNLMPKTSVAAVGKDFVMAEKRRHSSSVCMVRRRTSYCCQPCRLTGSGNNRFQRRVIPDSGRFLPGFQS